MIQLGTPEKIQTFQLRPRMIHVKYRDDFDTFEGWQWSGTNVTREVVNSVLRITLTATGNFDMFGKWTLPSKDNIALKIRFRVTRPGTQGYWIDIGFRKAPNDANNEIFICRINETARSPQCGKKIDGSYSYNTATPSIYFNPNTWYEFVLLVSLSYMSIWYYDSTIGAYRPVHSWFTDLPSGNVVPFVRGGGDSGIVFEIDYIEVGDHIGEGLKDPFILKTIDNRVYVDDNGYIYIFAQGSAGATYGQLGYYGQGVLTVYRTKDIFDQSKYEIMGNIFKVQKVSGDALLLPDNYVYIYYTYFPDKLTGGSGGIGVARIPLQDFIAGNWESLQDLGIKITATGARDPSVYYDPMRRKYFLVCRTDGPSGFSFYESIDGINFSYKGTLSGIYDPFRAGEHPTILTLDSDGKIILFASSTGGPNNLIVGRCDPDTLSCVDVRDIYSDPDYQTYVEAHVPTLHSGGIVSLYQVGTCAELNNNQNCGDGFFKILLMRMSYTPDLSLTADKTNVRVNEQFTLSFSMYPPLNVKPVLQRSTDGRTYVDVKEVNAEFGKSSVIHSEQAPGTYIYRFKVVI